MIARLVAASLRRRPRQLALIVAAVLVAAATVATLAGFSTRAERRLGAGLAAFGPNLVVRPQVGGASTLPADAASRVRAVPGVLSVTAVGASPAAPVRLDVRAMPERLPAVRQAIEQRVEGVEASALLKISDSDARVTRRLTLVLLAVSGVSFLLALLSVSAATAALVGERRVEVGLMLALGYSGRRVGALLAIELLAAALAAALAGEVLGELAAGGLSRHLLATPGRGPLGAFAAAGSGGGPAFTWTGMSAAAAVAVLVVGASLAVALRRIERLDAAGVLRGE